MCHPVVFIPQLLTIPSVNIFYQPVAEFAGVSEDAGMGMVGSDGPTGGPEAADEEDDEEDEEDEVLPDEARPLDTTAAKRKLCGQQMRHQKMKSN